MKSSPLKKLPYELVSDIFSYAKSPASCAVTKSFYNECVKKSLYEEEFVNDLSKKIAKAKNAKGVIKETCAENIYHKHICKKYDLRYKEHVDYIKEFFKYKPKRKFSLLERKVDLFVEKWDGINSIYEEPEAMNILEGESEEFVNMVIDNVDKGYRIGEDLMNFEYNDGTYKRIFSTKSSPRSSIGSASSTKSSPRSSKSSSSKSSPRSSIGSASAKSYSSKSSPLKKLPRELEEEIFRFAKSSSSCSASKSLYYNCVKKALYEPEVIDELSNIKMCKENIYNSHICKKYNIKSNEDLKSIKTYFDDIKSMHNIPKKDANFAVVTYINDYRFNYAFFNKYFKTLDEANEYAFMRAYNNRVNRSGNVNYNLAIGKDLKPFIKKRNIESNIGRNIERHNFFILPYKDEIISYLGGVYFFAVVKPYPGIENKWVFSNDKNMSLIYYPDSYYPSKTVYPLYMDSRDDSDWGNQIVENINAKTREKETKTVPWRTVVNWQVMGLKPSFFKL